MSELLEITILKKQNTQLAGRIDNYKKQNKELIKKNQELNTWTVNLSTILSSIEAAFRVFLENEESLYELIKPKGNKESTAIVAKCVNHFKHFNQILSNLSKKICSDDRSNKFTSEAKEGIQSLVSSYEIFFKQFLKSYFAFNQKQQQWIQSVLGSSDLRNTFRDLILRQKQNQQTIKSFSLHFQQLRSKFPSYQTETQRILLSDVLKKKNQELQVLKQRNDRFSIIYRHLLDYNQGVVSQAISDSEKFSCLCGGVQIAYLKQKWEKAEQLKNQEKQSKSQKGLDSQQRKLLQNQIQVLVKQNSGYLIKNEQLKIQNNIEQSVLKSQAYYTIVREAQELVKFCGSLQKKIKQLEEVIIQLQKCRQKQLRQLKLKYDSQRSHAPVPFQQSFNPKNKINGKQLCDMISNTFKPVLKSISDNKEWQQKYLAMEKQLRTNIQSLRQSNQAIKNKYEQYMKRQTKGQIQFKHQSHKTLVKQVETYLPKDGLLEKFSEFIKNRERKVQHLERNIRKLQKQLKNKQQFCDTMKKNYCLNETQFEVMSKKNQELVSSLQLMQQQIKKIVDENNQIKIQNQKEKSLLEMKLKSELDINSKNLMKIKLLEEKITKIEEIPKVYEQYVVNKDTALNEIKQKMEMAEEENSKINEELTRKLAKLREYQKSQKQYIQDNERLRSKVNAIKKTQAKTLMENNDEQKLNLALMELDEFKKKFMCVCQNRPVQVSLKSCSHMLCKSCVQDVLKSRSRACPVCRFKFSRTDVNEYKWI